MTKRASKAKPAIEDEVENARRNKFLQDTFPARDGDRMTKRASKAKPVVEAKTDEELPTPPPPYDPDEVWVNPMIFDRVEIVPVGAESPADTLAHIMKELQAVTLDNSAAQGALVAARMLIGNALRMLE